MRLPSLSRLSSIPSFAFVLLFLLIQLSCEIRDNTNGFSRYALLCALSEDRAFTIDNYKELTIDWAQTPDGRFYSNKAPGPALFALPAFIGINKLVGPTEPRAARDEFRARIRFGFLKWSSFFLQSLPFALLVLWFGAWAQANGVSAKGVRFISLVMLFGNTASLFMNTFFGHGFAAVCALAVLAALLSRRYFAVGLFSGALVLSDYAGALIAIPLLLDIVYDPSDRLRKVGGMALGAIAPVALFAYYHWICFGGPFVLPMKFQNPIFVEATGHAIWGVLGLPSFWIFLQLLFGSARGLLWTQPWIFSTWSCPQKRLLRFSVASLFALLWVNASFNGWHGGNSPGPRYLAWCLPYFALLSGWVFIGKNDAMRRLAIIGAAVSVILFIFVFATGEFPSPEFSLWGSYFEQFHSEGNAIVWVRALAMSVAFAWVIRAPKSEIV